MALLLLLIAGCSTAGPVESATALPTASAVADLAQPTETDTPAPTDMPTPSSEPQEPFAPITPLAASRCEGLTGQLELQVLVGPAEAVGLEPVAVGNVPIAVTKSAPPYLVEGQGPISYEATLTEKWGTYAVTMDIQTAAQGECSGEAGSEQLNLVLEMAGEQLVVVDAEGFHGEYPWAGTQTRDLAFPLEEGAMAQSEGWAVVLHLGSP